MKQKLGFILLAVFFLTGCMQGLQTHPAPMQSDGFTVEITDTPMPSHTVTATFTASPTSTLTPTLANTATPR
jgi:PBP1b-binding outer membrane lipoprotein LpoB